MLQNFNHHVGCSVHSSSQETHVLYFQKFSWIISLMISSLTHILCIFFSVTRSPELIYSFLTFSLLFPIFFIFLYFLEISWLLPPNTSTEFSILLSYFNIQEFFCCCYSLSFPFLKNSILFNHLPEDTNKSSSEVFFFLRVSVPSTWLSLVWVSLSCLREDVWGPSDLRIGDWEANGKFWGSGWVLWT